MATFIAFVIFIIVAMGCAYHHRSLITSIGILAVSLFILTLFGMVNMVAWILFALVSICLLSRSIRQNYLTKPAYKIFKRVLPNMSQTEKEALDAGTVWWEAELFCGKPNWQMLSDIKAPKLTQEEQDFLDGPVNQVCAMANDFHITHERADLPPEIWQFLKDHQFFAMIIKKQYGGLEFSAYAQSLVIQKLTGVSSVLAITVGVPNSLGPGELLQHYGTESQKDFYLPRLARGEEIPCFALTSPEAGSDAGAIPDHGTVCYGMWEGKEVLGMRLTWNKRYITLAPVATVLGLAFKLKDPDKLLGDETDLGITCALIPTDLDGVKIGRRHFPLNIPFQNGPTQGTDLFVPIDFIIGGASMAGQGWRMLVECLSVGRGITLPSNATGSAKTVALAVGAYARIRRQFKLPIGKMEGIEEPLARIAGCAYTLDAATQLTVTGIDLGEKPSVISAIVKYHCTQKGQHAILDAMDVAGGKGICLGSTNFLARFYQGAPIAITVEGANILTRSMIIYGQGAIRCHPYVLKEMEAAHANDANALERFDRALFGHVGFALRNVTRTIWLGLTDGVGSSAVGDEKTKGYYQKLNRYSANLAFLSDVSMLLLGGNLKRKERLSARLGDVLSELYLSSAVLKRFELDGCPPADLPLFHWCMQSSLHAIEKALVDLLDNMPNRGLMCVLKRLIFPFGARRKMPTDFLDHQVAQLLQTPSETRSRLGRGQYFEPSEHNTVGLIEQALHTLLKAEPLFDKVCKMTETRRSFTQLDKVAEIGLAQHILTEEEAAVLIAAEQERLYVINVNDFAPDAFAASSH